jgi:hypothetical protein
VCGEYFVWIVVDLTSWMNGWKDGMCAVFTQLYRICVAIVFCCFDFGLTSWLHTYWFFISINTQKKVLQEDGLELTTARLEDQYSNHMATGPDNFICSNAWFVVLCMPNVCFDFFVIVYVLLRTYDGCYILNMGLWPD